jgi:hypothetical protein
MMKVLLTAIAVSAAAGSAFAHEPVGKRTPNGGFEYYSNHHAGKGTVDNGCILPWFYAGNHTLGQNPKRIDRGEITEFYDCEIERPVQVVVPPVTAAPAPVVPPKVDQTPKPVPAPMPPQEQPKPVRE